MPPNMFGRGKPAAYNQMLGEHSKLTQVERDFLQGSMDKKQTIMYTDGACEGNPGPGGIGIVMECGETHRELSQGYRLTTNNRMEILAVVVGLESIKESSQVTLYSDSKYVVDAMRQGWATNWASMGWVRKGGKRVPNADLWKRLLPLIEKHEVTFKWVKGHAGHRGNEKADQLSYAAIGGTHLLEDEGYLQQLELEKLSPTKITEEGQPCRKCGTPVVKKYPKRKPKSGQTYYFEYYLQCPHCQSIYMVEKAKRSINQKPLFKS
jgi:ribonuclease HI